MVRNRLNLKTGDKIDFRIRDGEVILVPVSRSVSDVFGILTRKGGREISIEEMNEALRKNIREKSK